MPVVRLPHPSLPRLIAHADWGSQADKRQTAIAVRDDGYYHLLPPEPVGDLWELPGRTADRRTRGAEMLNWAAQRPVVFDERLVGCLAAGFGEGPEGEDQFNAVAGLLMMVDVVLNYRGEGTPADDAMRRIEGWIFGQAPRFT